MAKQPTSAKKPAHPAKAAKATAAAPPNHAKNGKKAAKPEPKSKAKPAEKGRPAAAANPTGKGAAAKSAAPKKARTDLSPKILHLIAEEMAIEEAELTPTASFKEDLNLDEIDIAELLMQAEQSFGVHPFSEEDWESCETVNDLIQLIEKRVAAKRAKKPAGKA